MGMTNIEQQIIASSRAHGGLVTTWDMNARGISTDSLVHWARRHGDYDKLGHGVYNFYTLNERENINTDDQKWWLPLCQVADPEAYLYGESVFAFYDLGYAMPKKDYVRAKTSYTHMPDKATIVSPMKPEDRVDIIRGVRLQSLAQAFNEVPEMRTDYLLEAAEDAYDHNLLTGYDYMTITNKLNHQYKKAA